MFSGKLPELPPSAATPGLKFWRLVPFGPLGFASGNLLEALAVLAFKASLEP